LILIIWFFGCINCSAQVSATGNGIIRTVAGQLAIEKVSHIGADSVTFEVSLAGRAFDKLYGLTHIYYPDSGLSDKANGRVLMEDFIGGADVTPVIMLYDFRGKSPQVLQITDKLDVDDIRWRQDGVLLEANNKWYIYRRGKLFKVNSTLRKMGLN
jgi:hypothetical protein